MQMRLFQLLYVVWRSNNVKPNKGHIYSISYIFRCALGIYNVYSHQIQNIIHTHFMNENEGIL